MNHVRPLALIASCALLALACDESISPTPNPASDDVGLAGQAPPTPPPPLGGIVRPIQPGAAALAYSAGAPLSLTFGPVDTQRIKYHGGPVANDGLNLVAIYWSKSKIYTSAPAPGTMGAGTADNSLIGYYLSNLGASSRYKINTTYYDDQKRTVARSLTYTRYWAYDNAPRTKVPRDTVVKMLKKGFTSGALTYDPRTLYIVFTGTGINLGGGFGTQYCAYHTYDWVLLNNVWQKVLWSAMPYGAGNASCNITNAGWLSPNGDLAADVEVNVLTHEIEETATDMYIDAWYDVDGSENADKCAWTFGTVQTVTGNKWYNVTVGTKPFLVQRNWLRTGGCKSGI